MRRCVVCDRVLLLHWVVDHFDESMCTGCSTRPRCWCCSAATGGAGVRARHLLADGRIRCDRCDRDAVDSPADVARVVAVLRPFLTSLGIALPNRVRVELAAPDEIQRLGGAHTYGLTVTRTAPVGEVLAIRVVDGLAFTPFGQVLAHEIGHGWLAGCRANGMTAVEEEGLCELVAAWWLEHRGGPLARHLLRVMLENPDTVYGDGFRRMRLRMGSRSQADVVAEVEAKGRLG